MVENKRVLYLVLATACTLFTSCSSEVKRQPNIIVLMADDMGWNDVSFHGSDDIPTPNIDALAYYGISLNRFYTPPLCTPSRGSFLTGKYSIHLGLQRFVIANDEPWGLDPREKILPQYLQEVGYSTYLVGKWHLGFYRREYTPTERGFDSFYGYYGGFIDYYRHSAAQKLNQPKWGAGYDFRRNFSVDYESDGEYVTSLFTKYAVDTIRNHDKQKPMFLMVNHLAPHAGDDKTPLKAPSEIIKQFSYINNPVRRTLAAVISIMDSGIGKVIKALRDNDMLENSVILFYSDNGAPSFGPLYNFGSNYPFKGQKDSPWEGALRVPAAIWSPLLGLQQQRVSNQLYHVTDWFPTLLKLAGVTNIPATIDGNDIWPSLSQNAESPRTSIVHNIDDYVSFTKGEYKYVRGSRIYGLYDWWIGDKIYDIILYNPYRKAYNDLVRNSAAGKILANYSPTGRRISDATIKAIRDGSTVRCGVSRNFCFPMLYPCLFNIVQDPCERYNLYFTNRAKATEMEQDVAAIRKTIIPARNKKTDVRSNPQLHCNTWVSWQDDDNIVCSHK